MIDLNHWNAFWYQLQEIQSFNPESVLIVGKGIGVIDDILKSNGVDVTTFDIDTKLHPDVVGDVRMLTRYFNREQFDVAVCCEVLEHIPYKVFTECLAHLGYVSRKGVVISLPYNGMFIRFGMDAPLFHNKNLAVYIPYHKPVHGGHQWAINHSKETSFNNVAERIRFYCKQATHYRIPVFPYIHMFRMVL